MVELGPVELICLLMTGVAAYTDIKTQRIPNLLTVPAIPAGILINSTGLISVGPFVEFGGLGWQASVAGAAVGFGLTLAVSLLSRGGGGDIKLAAALGAFLGVRGVFVVLAATFISAAVCSVSYFILRDGVISTLRLLTTPPAKFKNCTKGVDLRGKHADAIAIPMGPFFLLGSLFVAISKHCG